MMNQECEVSLEVVNLRKHFPAAKRLLRRPDKWIKAVDGISFALGKGETLSLIGESGCGKTTTARLILDLDTPTSGAVLFAGKDVHNLDGSDRRRYRSSVQAVFQDPWASLDPRMTLFSIISEPLFALKFYQNPRDVKSRVMDLLDQVGLSKDYINRYPHQLSGGQRQRVAIARALAPFPSFIVLDEPVSALDVSIRAQILNLLKDLQKDSGLSYLMIAHNLATVRFMSAKVAVMYLGQIIEEGPAEELFDSPAHPYTQALISASLPSHPSEVREEMVLEGEVPSSALLPPGCRFHTRCPVAMPYCARVVPVPRTIAPDHIVQCHLS